MAKQYLNISKVNMIPFDYNGKIVMGKKIGNTFSHYYIIDEGKIKFVRWSDPDDKYIEVKGGPAPKIGDNLCYFADGKKTTWRYIKPPRKTEEGRIMWNAGFQYLDDSDFIWSDNIIKTLNSCCSEYVNTIFSNNPHPYDMGKLLLVVYYEEEYKFKGIVYTIPTPRYIIANERYREEIESNLKGKILDILQGMGEISETKISGIYLPKELFEGA